MTTVHYSPAEALSTVSPSRSFTAQFHSTEVHGQMSADVLKLCERLRLPGESQGFCKCNGPSIGRQGTASFDSRLS